MIVIQFLNDEIRIDVISKGKVKRSNQKLKFKKSVLIGRGAIPPFRAEKPAKGVDIAISADTVSRKHCIIRNNKIYDVASTWGVRIKREGKTVKLKPHKGYNLWEGDIVGLAAGISFKVLKVK